MKAVKLTTESGYSWTTDVSDHSTKESATKYFVGNKFDVAAYPNEKLEKVVKIEFLDWLEDLPEVDRLARLAGDEYPSMITPAQLETIIKRESKLPYSIDLQCAVFRKMVSLFVRID